MSDSEGDWELNGHDAPDSAGNIHKSNTEDTGTPSFPVKDGDDLVDLSSHGESAAVQPIQPISEQTGEAVDPQKSPGKPRRPRASKTIQSNTAGIPTFF